MKSNLLKIAGVSLAALTFAAACGGEPPKPAEPAPVAETPAPPPGPDYAALLAAPDRFAGDADRDAARKSAEVLAFSKIMPGQTVFEIEAGGGYFTELLSRAVGPTGKVIMQSPKEFDNFYPKVAERLANNRLANVTKSSSMFDKLDAADASVDVVTWFQGPHELYCTTACGGLKMGEPAAVFTEISRILKPGGLFVIIDHSAPQGTPTTSGNIHRIDKMQVMSLATAANFALEEESNILANPADDQSVDVFNEKVAGKTDQFLLRYKKP